MGKDMPLSSLADPVELAQASAALEAAWNEIRLTPSDPCDERERTRLAYMIASLVAVAKNPDDLRSSNSEKETHTSRSGLARKREQEK